MNKQQMAETQELHKPHRLWMTESYAVLMAALGPLQGCRSVAGPTVRHSPYSVDETVQRIEAGARQQGLSVLAELDGTEPVIVFGSSIGGTPVVMDHADSRPAIPLSLGVRQCAGGGADVLLAAAARDCASDWADLPAQVTDDLAALPKWVDLALT
jgi:hypothetical protein